MMPTSPANRPSRPVVATSVNRKALRYLSVMLDSLATAEQLVPPHVVVLWRGLTTKDRLRVVSPAARSLYLTWIEADELGPAAGIKRSLLRSLTPHYFRLLVPHALPNEPRALYLDADTLILRPLAPLWQLELGEWFLAATQDYLPNIGDAVSNCLDLGLDPQAPYFNSGVMLMDLRRWRDAEVAVQVERICAENAAYLAAQGRWPQFDQYGLNVLLHHRWLVLDPRWNHGAHLPGRDPCVVHFAGDAKPEQAACRPEYRELFHAQLSRTGFDTTEPTCA